MKVLFPLIALLLLAVVFISGCISNQSTMDIGTVDRAVDLPRAMPTEPPPTDNITYPMTASGNDTNSTDAATQAYATQVTNLVTTAVVLMIPLVILASALNVIRNRD